MPGIAHALDTTLEILQFLGCFPFGPQEMGDTKDQSHKAQREYELDTDGEITDGIIQI